jgi:hypothetical protein
MENYYIDNRVILALEKSSKKLMDITTFIKEINFEINSDLTFDVLWTSLTKRRYIYIYISLLEWLGYSGPKELHKQAFTSLLERNNIPFKYISYQDPLIEKFPEIQEEVENMRPVDKPRKRWIIMDTNNFKKAIMRLNTSRRDGIQNYYLLLEELIQLYGAYTYKFKEMQKDKELKDIKEELEDTKEHALILQEMMVKDDPVTRTQVIYIATTELYAKSNNFKSGGVDETSKLKSRLSTYNTGRVKDDLFYYSDIFMVSNYHIIEAQLKNLLGRFRDKKEKEMYRLHYSDVRYIVDYLCKRDGEDVEEVNSKLTQFIANLNKRNLRPIVPPPNTTYLTSVTHLQADGTVDNVTIQSDSFEEAVKEYVKTLDPTTTVISKKKIFDDLKIRKNRTSMFPMLEYILGQLRPEIMLLKKS